MNQGILLIIVKKDYDKIVKILEDLLIDNDLCFRCYRKGYYANSCYAKTTITGEKINNNDDNFCCNYCGKKFDTAKGVTYHKNLYCKNKETKKKIKI